MFAPEPAISGKHGLGTRVIKAEMENDLWNHLVKMSVLVALIVHELAQKPQRDFGPQIIKY